MGHAELIMVLTSALLHAVWSAVIKGSRSPLAFNLLQAGLAAGLCLVLLPTWEPRDLSRAAWLGVLATGVAHGLYYHWLTRAYEVADLSVVYPIVRSTPALLPLIAVPLLGERISPMGGLGIAVVVIGIWAVHGAGSLRAGAFLRPGTGFAYLTLLTTVAYSLLDKQVMAELDASPWRGDLPRSVAFYLVIHMVCFAAFAVLSLRRVRRAEVAAVIRGEGGRLLLAIGVGIAGYGLILEAYREAPASYVVAVRQASVVFAVGIAMVWLRERPGPVRIAGALATVAGVGLIALD